jgi:hypothetical protein
MITWTCWLQVAEQNLKVLGSSVRTVYGAIVQSTTAKEKDTLQFTGEKNQYWGYRVAHPEEEGTPSNTSELVTFDVPTKTLKQLRVRLATCKRDYWK